MNNINLYRQILQGKWFIHYSYALTMGQVLHGLLPDKSMSDVRSWDSMATVDLAEMKERAPLPISIGTVGAGRKKSVNDFNDVPEGSVAVIPIKGVMLKYGTICEYGTEEISSVLESAAKSANIGSIVLDIDSGGGSVDSIAPLTQAIDLVRGKYKKPIVACGDLCASAAYYVASHCDKIVAANEFSSEWGSIGVMMSFWDITPYYEKEGFKFHKIYAPESTHKNLAFEQALKGKYDLIKEEELSPLARGFQETVKKNRAGKLNMEVEGLLNGRMFYATNQRDEKLSATSVGLIDEIGSLDYAIDLAASMAEARTFMTK